MGQKQIAIFKELIYFAKSGWEMLDPDPGRCWIRILDQHWK